MKNFLENIIGAAIILFILFGGILGMFGFVAGIIVLITGTFVWYLPVSFIVMVIALALWITIDDATDE